MNIYWSEGLFLRPHHLQLMQRSINDNFARERSLGFSYPYGLIESEVSRDDLANKRLKFKHLKVIMPSGLYVALGENSDMPSLNIEQVFSRTQGGFMVYLGVPLYNELRANTQAAGQNNADSSRLLYRINEIALRDENTGENPKPVQLRRINARLLLDTDDFTDMETLPLCRIMQATGDEVGLPQLDGSFCPPCFVLSGYQGLNEMLRDLSNQVCSSRDKLGVQIKQGGFNIENMRGPQFEQMMRLRTLTRFGSRLTALATAPHITPFSIFLELSELHGELAALQPHKEHEAIGGYDHNNPLPVFKKLMDAIREHLKGSVASTYLKLECVHQDGLFEATMEDQHLTQPNDYYVAITSKDDPQALVRLVEDGNRFKLMAKSLIMRPIRGVKLKEERVPPMEFPAGNNMYYFRILRQDSGRIWTQIEQEKAIAIRWPGMENSDYAITFYMTVPN
jgi:type VI secretion system protein ImpJ